MTRPTLAYWGLDSFEGDGKHATWKLFPGATAQGELVSCSVLITAVIDDAWAVIAAAIIIDDLSFPAQPGLLFIARDPQMDSTISAAIHFPVLSVKPELAGRHTILLRTVPKRRPK